MYVAGMSYASENAVNSVCIWSGGIPCASHPFANAALCIVSSNSGTFAVPVAYTGGCAASGVTGDMVGADISVSMGGAAPLLLWWCFLSSRDAMSCCKNRAKRRRGVGCAGLTYGSL